MNEGNPFSPFLKDAGEFFPISKLEKGQRISYQGQGMYVVTPGEYVVYLNKDPNGTESTSIKVNQNMFTQFAIISKEK